MKKIIKLAIFLGIVAAITATALYFTNNITAPIIEKNTRENTERMLKEIVPDATKFETQEIKEGRVSKLYIALKDDEKLSFVYEINAFGFQSQMIVLVAISPEGKFAGFKVVEQAETPGYGTQILESPYKDQFTTKTIDDEIDIISGSTVTTRPLNEAIGEAIAHFRANHQ